MRFLTRLRGYRLLMHVGVIVTLWTVGSGALWFILPQIAESYVKNLALVGLITSIPAAIALFVDLPLGRLCDRIGGRKVLLTGLLALSILGACFYLVEGIIQLVVFMFFLGLLYQMVYIPLMGYVMKISPKEESSKYLGFELSFLHAGFAVGPVIVGFLLAYGYSMNQSAAILYTLGSFSALCFGYIWFKATGVYEKPIKGLRDLIVEDKVFVRELTDFVRLRQTGISILFMTFLFTFFDGVVWVLEPLYYGRFTQDAVAGGLIMSAFVLPLILFEVPAGYLADRFGRRKILALGIFVAGLFSILFGLADNVTELFLTAFFSTTGLAVAWPAMEGIFSLKTEDSSRGGVIGVWSTSRDMGYVLGPIGGGLLAHFIGIENVFIVLGLIFISTTAVAFRAGKE